MSLGTSGNLGEPLESGYPDIDTAYWGNLMPAISYAVDHGAAGAAEDWNRIVSASNFPTQPNPTQPNPTQPNPPTTTITRSGPSNHGRVDALPG